MTNQPKWRLIANLGDVSWLSYGGKFLLEDTTGVYSPELLIVQEPSEEDFNHNSEDDLKWTTYRFPLDKCTYIDGVLSDNQFHPESPCWWTYGSNNLKDISNNSGISELDLINYFCSDNKVSRAQVYIEVAEYHGYENFDSYPLSYSKKEIKSYIKKLGVK